MSYSEKDFAGCFCNPLKKNIFNAYPRLSELIPKDMLNSEEDNEKMVRYIIAMYDPGSPLIKEYRDITLRKRTAAMVAGYDFTKDEYFLIDLFSFSNNAALYGVSNFLKFFIHSRLWYMISAREQTIYEYAERMLKPVEAKTGDKEKDLMSAIAIKSKLSADMAEMNDLLEKDYNKFFGSDTDLSKAFKNDDYTPEKMATRV